MMSQFSWLKKCGKIWTSSWRGSDNYFANWVTSLNFRFLKSLKSISSLSKTRDMPMNEQIRHFYEFGPFKIDVNNFLLMLNTEIIALPRKSFDLLRLLVENQGQLVEKTRIIETVWSDIFVEESSLTTAISGLRKALGDDAARPQYIQTVAKRG